MPSRRKKRRSIQGYWELRVSFFVSLCLAVFILYLSRYLYWRVLLPDAMRRVRVAPILHFIASLTLNLYSRERTHSPSDPAAWRRRAAAGMAAVGRHSVPCSTTLATAWCAQREGDDDGDGRWIKIPWLERRRPTEKPSASRRVFCS